MALFQRTRPNKRIVGSGLADSIFKIIKIVGPHLLPALSSLAVSGADILGSKLKKLAGSGVVQNNLTAPSTTRAENIQGQGLKLAGRQPGRGVVRGTGLKLAGRQKNDCGACP